MMQAGSYNMKTELEVYNAMFGALPQSMFSLDRNKDIIGIFNATPETLAGFSVGDLVGRSILEFVNDPSSPLHEACSMLNDTCDSVFSTGEPLKFQYKILETYLEALVSRISGDRILSQVRDITDIVRQQQRIEQQTHNELSVALMAGGFTSWSYDVQKRIISSKHENNVIPGDMPIDDLLALIVPEHRQLTLDMFEEIIEEGSRFGHVTVHVMNCNGLIQWSDVHAIPLKKLIRQNELILNNTHLGFVYLTPDLQVEWENVSDVFTDPGIACLISNGKLCDNDCMHHRSCTRSTIIRALEQKTSCTGKFRTENRIVIESTVQPLRMDDGRIEGVVVRIDDITSREQTVSELARAKEMTEQSDKLKSAFLANMSHEIRTPLNSIVGFAQLLLDAETKEKQKAYVDIVHSNSEMLLNLINDILDLSKIEAGYLSCNDSLFNLSDLFGEMEFIFRHKVPEEVGLFCDVPRPEFTVNLDRLSRANPFEFHD